ncbi:hypothetical protein AG1IA_04796 [Rhizoctonia solani AG-1 IA]|uniref:Uncharacterized protein n=1 Tax=Thanatephorus cucumeris (strain AG1-IA) TaxID=983506 RepID=L8WXT3_THACA|nr:hypothetical protein AG1IA_04796 [Rhizoctonia solani AG-1 IA]
MVLPFRGLTLSPPLEDHDGSRYRNKGHQPLFASPLICSSRRVLLDQSQSNPVHTNSSRGILSILPCVD